MNVVSEAMEAIGGNAYVEESVLPRLLRDCQVLPIWEGTSNVLALDVLRAVRKEEAGPALLDRIARALDATPSGPEAAALADEVRRRLDEDRRSLAGIATLGDDDAARAIRPWIDCTGRTLTLALLLENAAHSTLRDASLAAGRRLLCRPSASLVAGASHAAGLETTEEPLLAAAFAG